VAEATSKLICPNCQVEMNHHSDKLVYATDKPQAGTKAASSTSFMPVPSVVTKHPVTPREQRESDPKSHSLC